MAIQTINIGNVVNDGLGDDLRTAFQKVNANFAVLDAQTTVTGSNVGTTGTGIFKQKTGANLEFKKLISGTRITITEFPDTIQINNTASIAFTRFDTDAGQVTAGVGNTDGQITLAGTSAPGSTTTRKDIEVTTSGSTVYFKTIIPVVDILTSFDFGFITGAFTNSNQLALAAANIDFGTILLPGTLNLNGGELS